MANIIEFPSKRVKKFAVIDCASEVIDTVDAVNELTCELLCEVIPVYIEHRWSLAELDAVVGDFTSLMIANAPPRIIRSDLDQLKGRLRPIWRDMMSSLHPKY